MIYINSKGEEVDTATMNESHLVNALVKSVREQEQSMSGLEHDAKLEANIESLKEEILKRIK